MITLSKNLPMLCRMLLTLAADSHCGGWNAPPTANGVLAVLLSLAPLLPARKYSHERCKH